MAHQEKQGVTEILTSPVTPCFLLNVGLVWDFHPAFSKTFIASCSASPME